MNPQEPDLLVPPEKLKEALLALAKLEECEKKVREITLKYKNKYERKNTGNKKPTSETLQKLIQKNTKKNEKKKKRNKKTTSETIPDTCTSFMRLDLQNTQDDIAIVSENIDVPTTDNSNVMDKQKFPASSMATLSNIGNSSFMKSPLQSTQNDIAIVSGNIDVPNTDNINLMDKQKFSASSMATLSNIGNTCFMNSVLYTLRCAPRFLHCIHQLFEDKIPITDKNIMVTEELHQLYKNLHQNESAGTKSAFKPHTFLKAVGDVDNTFRNMQQQDAHEFLMFLLNCLQETTCRYSRVNFVQRNFEGITRSTMKCGSCDTVTENFVPMINISIPITGSIENPNLFIQVSLVLMCDPCMFQIYYFVFLHKHRERPLEVRKS